MPNADLMREGGRILTICNACRYCEGYCAVFPAMERRRSFTAGDLNYLANLCHNCGECLYACQYAPPHEFGVNVPRTLAQIRLESYKGYSWPRGLSKGFERHSVLTSLAVAGAFTAFILAVSLAFGRDSLNARQNGDFYQVVPHGVMVALFGAVFGLATLALGIGFAHFWRDVNETPAALGQPAALRDALRDVLTLKYLHGEGADCTYEGVEARSPWRRWFHHATYYGFLLCFASTSVAAVYHLGFGWKAPYAYSSLPVLLGTAGGIGLLIGPAGLFWLRRTRDPATADPAQTGFDLSFIVLLLLSSVTGLLLLVFRARAVMAPLLIVHLGVVLALFVTLPYGKFVHGVYRSAALIKHALEGRRAHDVSVLLRPSGRRARAR